MNLSDLVADTTAADVKKKILSYAASANLKVTSWMNGDPSMVIITIVATLIYLFSIAVKQAIRAHFLDLATDPGDDGLSQPAKGWLSAKGEGDYGTTRIDSTFASGEVTLENTSAVPVLFGPEELTFQNAITGKTYRNVYDPTLYPEPARTCTIAPGASVDIPVEAEEVGTASNAAPGEISIMVLQLIGVTVTNTSPVLGTDRESADSYRERCRIAASATSPNGPADAYRYIALSANKDGTIGGTGKERVGIRRVSVTKNSTTGTVDAYFASSSGAADPSDFATVNALIQRLAVPDCVTYTGHNAIEDTIAITYTVEVTADPGLTEADVETAVAARLAALFELIPIGGYKNNGTSGTLFLSRIRAEIGKSHPSIFNVIVSLPAGDVTILTGHVAKLGTITPTVDLVS